MTSVQARIQHPDIEAASTLRFTDPPRWELSPTGTSAAWWPVCTEPIDAIRELVQLASADLGRLTQLAYNSDEWGPIPRRLSLGTTTVTCDGIGGPAFAHCVVITSDDQRRIQVAVVPRTASLDSARRMMTLVEDAAVGSAMSLLVRAGALSSMTRSTAVR